MFRAKFRGRPCGHPFSRPSVWPKSGLFWPFSGVWKGPPFSVRFGPREQAQNRPVSGGPGDPQNWPVLDPFSGYPPNRTRKGVSTARSERPAFRLSILKKSALFWAPRYPPAQGPGSVAGGYHFKNYFYV